MKKDFDDLLKNLLGETQSNKNKKEKTINSLLGIMLCLADRNAFSFYKPVLQLLLAILDFEASEKLYEAYKGKTNVELNTPEADQIELEISIKSIDLVVEKLNELKKDLVKDKKIIN